MCRPPRRRRRCPRAGYPVCRELKNVYDNVTVEISAGRSRLSTKRTGMSRASPGANSCSTKQKHSVLLKCKRRDGRRHRGTRLADRRGRRQVPREIRGLVDPPGMHLHRGDGGTELPREPAAHGAEELDLDRAARIDRAVERARLDHPGAPAQAGDLAEHVVERHERVPEPEHREHHDREPRRRSSGSPAPRTGRIGERRSSWMLQHENADIERRRHDREHDGQPDVRLASAPSPIDGRGHVFVHPLSRAPPPR